jgi:hypothetical protein
VCCIAPSPFGGAAVDRDAVPGVEVGRPHDLEEQEADRFAEVVMRSAEPDQAEQPPVRPGDARARRFRRWLNP